MSREGISARVFRNVDEEQRAERDYWQALGPSDRLAMMWQLTIDAWAFTGQAVAESRLPRTVVHVHRRER
ncbi:MAG: hypothetical protein U0Q12_14845 [Vicinamibacterales bacterium]